MTQLKLSLIYAAIIIFTSGCSETSTTNSFPTNAEVTSTPVQSKSSELRASMPIDIYAENCIICHKDSGKGGKVTIEGETINADDLTALKIKNMTDEKLIGYVTNGVPDEGMPAFKDKLSESEIKSVVGHVRALQAK